jgi:rhodanese-related sulfurtransferase
MAYAAGESAAIIKSFLPLFFKKEALLLLPSGYRMKHTHPITLRDMWRRLDEVALLDVREEAAYADAHPFFAVSLPLSRLETGVLALVPRLSVPVIVYDDGEGLAQRAAAVLIRLGYRDVSILEGGLTGYAAQGEVFRDVNVPSKAFGELVESIRQTPSLPAGEAAALIASQPDLVVLDARRFEEFNTMSVPRGMSVPGGELVRRIADLVPSPCTTVIVNCAGRTRSIIGTQSLVNAGLPNPVYALRNGTIGWTLAGHTLDHGQTRRHGTDSLPENLALARQRAAAWASRVGVRTIDATQLAILRAEAETRTLYLLDVRTPEEHAIGHPCGFAQAPGGQLVQALDEWVGVRGARLVLYDDDGVRAPMAASWLVQMGWEAMLIGPDGIAADADGVAPRPLPPLPPAGDAAIDPAQLAAILPDVTVLDLAPSPAYRAGHIPGSHFVIRARIGDDLRSVKSGAVVLTSLDGVLATFALPEVRAVLPGALHVLAGGTSAWRAAGYPVTGGDPLFLSTPDDVYKRPYEGTDNPAAAMQAYIDWEHRLVAQLANDGICRFRVA